MARAALVLVEEPTDGVLVGAACEGDTRAKEVLYRRHAALVAGVAYRLLGHDGELEDIVQESFATAFGSLERLREPEAFRSWLIAIATGATIATIRRRRWLSFFGLLRDESLPVGERLSSATPAEVALELRALYRKLQRLPTEERVILVLRRVEELPLEEIARRTGWSLATIKRRLASATRRIEQGGEDGR